MLTSGIQVMKYIRASAGRAGIQTVFEDVNHPRHDGKTIYLPRITASTTEEELKQLMCSTDHEVAHDRFSCFAVLKEKALDGSGILMFTWNFLEDSRVNVIEANEYKGFRELWDECTAEILEKIFKKAAAAKDSTVAKLVHALICWDSKVCSGLFPTANLIASGYTPNKDISDVLSNFSDRLVACHSILDKRLGTEATYQLAYDILTALGATVKVKPGECGEGGGKDDKGTKVGKDGKPIGGKKEDKGAEAKAESATSATSSKEGEKGEAEKPEDEDYKVIEVVLTEKDLEDFSITAPEEIKPMSKVGINFEPVALHSGSWDLTDFDKFLVIDYSKGTGRDDHLYEDSNTRGFIKEYNSRIKPKLISQENFAQQVRKLIQIRAKVQTQYGTKKGKLDQSRLSRICFNAPGFNEKVFKTKIENKTLDACISVLVDMSGSMSGDKAYYALAATQLLNEVCSTLNIPVEILGFTDTYYIKPTVPAMYIYKGFNDLKVSNDTLEHSFSLSSTHMEGNPDGENILWAYDRLVKRKEKKKILVVMSDGSPAASKKSFGVEQFTLKAIQEIEAAKRVDIDGLGLLSAAVRHYYKSNDVVNSPEEIPSKLISLIERKIIHV